MQQGLTNIKVQFVLFYTKRDGSSTESLISHLKSKKQNLWGWKPPNYSGTGSDL